MMLLPPHASSHARAEGPLLLVKKSWNVRQCDEVCNFTRHCFFAGCLSDALSVEELLVISSRSVTPDRLHWRMFESHPSSLPLSLSLSPYPFQCGCCFKPTLISAIVAQWLWIDGAQPPTSDGTLEADPHICRTGEYDTTEGLSAQVTSAVTASREKENYRDQCLKRATHLLLAGPGVIMSHLRLCLWHLKW